jgi:hypothetical protein
MIAKKRKQFLMSRYLQLRNELLEAEVAAMKAFGMEDEQDTYMQAKWASENFDSVCIEVVVFLRETK